MEPCQRVAKLRCCLGLSATRLALYDEVGTFSVVVQPQTVATKTGTPIARFAPRLQIGGLSDLACAVILAVEQTVIARTLLPQIGLISSSAIAVVGRSLIARTIKTSKTIPQRPGATSPSATRLPSCISQRPRPPPFGPRLGTRGIAGAAVRRQRLTIAGRISSPRPATIAAIIAV